MGKEIILIRTILSNKQLEIIKEHLKDKYIIISNTEKDGSSLFYEDSDVKILVVHELSIQELNRYNNIKFVQIYGRGTDRICIQKLEERKICYRKFIGTLSAEAIAEYVLLQILYWERNIDNLNEMAHSGKWTWNWRSKFEYRALKQLKVGIIGNGMIGTVIFNYLYNLNISTFFINVGKRMTKIDEELIKQMDYITIHLPLNKSTENIVDRQFFEKMNRNAVLINTSRGRIINEEHMIEALEDGSIRAASIDVTEKEPIEVESPLSLCNKIIITPHIAGRTKEALVQFAFEIVDNINKEVWK